MKRFKDILCVVETGNEYEAALECAIKLAENNQASLTVVEVAELVPADIGRPAAGPRIADFQAAMVKEHAQDLKKLADSYRSRIDIKTSILTGVPFLEIIREVLRNKHDLVIKATEPQGWLDRLLGSNDMHLLRKCPCPVWLIKPQAEKSYRRILAAVDVGDGDQPAERESRNLMTRQILEMASSLAIADFAQLHIGHVWDAIGEGLMRGRLRTPEEEVNSYVEQVRRQHESCLEGFMREMASNLGQDAMNYIKPETHLVKGWARKEIPNLAKQIDADLIVMGTVGRTGIPGFIMGNTAETILDQINCSVLAIKPPGFITPVTLEE